MVIQTITDAGADSAVSFQLQHRYMAGLRFNGSWESQVRARAGQWRWKAFDLWEPSSRETRELDPQGAWWCVRQCSALMGQRSRTSPQLPKLRSPCPEPSEMLQALLPSCNALELNTDDAEGPPGHFIDELVATIEKQGCALLRFEAAARPSVPSRVRWVWMVGTEARVGDNSLSALLVVGPHWPAPWGSGFGARAHALPDGSWKICSVDGEVMQGQLTGCITAGPAAGGSLTAC